MTIHVSREAWGARPPEKTTPLVRAGIRYFIVHYSGAVRTQTVQSIQNFCMDNKGHSDIDYNRLVRGEFDYMGRGWNVGSHTLNYNSISYGVCVIGLDGDATDDDLRTVREIYDQVCAELGRQLIMTDHRNLLGTGYTSCPGDELDLWVDVGMPYPEGGTVDQAERDRLALVQDKMYVAATKDTNFFENVPLPNGTTENQPFPAAARLKTVAADVAEIKARPPVQAAPISQEQLNAAVETAILQPNVLAAIARAVTDEIGS
jgi:hypothetical protein